MNFRRIAISLTAATVGAASLLVPSGAGAGMRQRTTPSWRLNGVAAHAPVYVSCRAGAARGAPVSRNVITTRGGRDIRFTVTFLSDRKHPVVLGGTRRVALPKSLSLPCSGVGQVRYRVERLLPRRAQARRRALGGVPAVTAMASFGATAPRLPRRTQLIEQSILDVSFVGVAS